MRGVPFEWHPRDTLATKYFMIHSKELAAVFSSRVKTGGGVFCNILKAAVLSR